MSATQDDSNSNSSGGKPPIFSGDAKDFPLWLRKVELWMSLMVPKEKSKAGAKLVNAQTNDVVSGYMLEVPNSMIMTDDGVDAIIAKLKVYFGKADELSAWDLFLKWWMAKRSTNENAKAFCRLFMHSYSEIKNYDAELKISDRMLSFILIAQLNLSSTNRALIMSNLEKSTSDITPQKVLEALGKMESANIKIEDDGDGAHSFNGYEEQPHEHGSHDDDSDDRGKVEVHWHSDGSCTRVYGNGDKEYFSPEGVQAMPSSFMSKGKGGMKGSTKGSTKGRTARPEWEGDESKGIPNQRNLRCYDCESRFHAVGHPSCKKPSGMFAYAGFAVVDEAPDPKRF